MRTPSKLLSLISSLLVALTVACSSGQLSEQRVHASAKNAPTQQDVRTIAAVVKAAKANLRAKPSAAAAVVSTVNRGDLLSLISPTPTGPWYQIRESKNGSEGWIHGDTIDLLQTAETNATSTRQATRPRIATPQRTASTPATTSKESSVSTKSSASTPGKSYVNVDGIRVRSPVFSETKPEGASARCRDGSYSFSLHRRGTCSHHGGVAEWYE